MQNMIQPKQVSLRVPPGVLKLVEQDIEENGEHLNRTEWIMVAINRYLDHRCEIGAIKRDSSGGGGSI